jgi:hypothetical protein
MGGFAMGFMRYTPIMLSWESENIIQIPLSPRKQMKKHEAK